MEIHNIFTLIVDMEKTLCTLEDIYRSNFVAKFYENSMLTRAIDSIFESADFPAPKTETAPPPGKSDFHETLLAVSIGGYLQVNR